MMKVKKIVTQVILGCILVISLGCTAQCEYDSIEELYQASIITIKSKDKEQIEKFVKTILPDKSTAEYMKKNNCVYRGFPEKLKENPNAIESSIDFVTQEFYNFASHLEERYGNLDNLQFIGFERDISPEPLNEPRCKCQDVLFEEIWGKLVFSHSNDTIPYKVGELLKVNGKWKAFTIRLGI